MKKFLQFVFNFFWVLIVGISSAISSALTGVACLVTIVGIPFGLQHFKFIPLVFAPAGKTVIDHYGSHPVMNTLWLLFGGLAMTLLYGLLGCICIITVIGIPLGLQLFKIAGFNFAPFGVEIVKENQFSSNRNTYYDYLLLGKKIVANPDVAVGQKEDGTPLTIKEYFAQFANQYGDFSAKWSKYFKLHTVILPVLDFVVFIVAGTLYYANFLFIYALPILFAVTILIPTYVLNKKYMPPLKEYRQFDSLYLPPLMNYFEGDMSKGRVQKFYVYKTDNVWAGIYKKFYDNKSD